MKKLQGKITSLKNIDTAVVEVQRVLAHPLYQKLVRTSKKYACGIDAKEIKVDMGDIVEIVETRPLSKTKRFKIVKKIGK